MSASRLSSLGEEAIMIIYFLRHGEADWPDWDKPDDERPLTSDGAKEMQRVARLLGKLKVSPALIISSPLPRAWQTARIVADGLGVELAEEAALRPGFDASKLKTILKSKRGGSIMLVGHEPDFSSVIRSLTGGRVKLAKAGLARVDLDENGGAGRLIWLVPPKISAR